jgi:sec-independent protein translocase protein TatC
MPLVSIKKLLKIMPSKSTKQKGTARLSMVGHLEELRRRLGICIFFVVIFSCVGFAISEKLLAWLKDPADSLLPFLAISSPTEALSAYLKIGVLFGLSASMPFIIYEIWAFVRPALKNPERLSIFSILMWASVLFFAGAAMGYYFLLPLFLKFLLSIGRNELFPVISVGKYISFTLSVIFSCGVIFEMPLVIWMMSSFGVIDAKKLGRYRGVAIVSLLGIAAVLSPTTDAFNLILFSLPLIGLYEVSIIVLKVFTKK